MATARAVSRADLFKLRRYPQVRDTRNMLQGLWQNSFVYAERPITSFTDAKWSRRSPSRRTTRTIPQPCSSRRERVAGVRSRDGQGTGNVLGRDGFGGDKEQRVKLRFFPGGQIGGRRISRERDGPEVGFEEVWFCI